jgi:hypothetical protein
VKLSARNVLKGGVVDVVLGATTARVKITIAGGHYHGLDHRGGGSGPWCLGKE